MNRDIRSNLFLLCHINGFLNGTHQAIKIIADTGVEYSNVRLKNSTKNTSIWCYVDENNKDYEFEIKCDYNELKVVSDFEYKINSAYFKNSISKFLNFIIFGEQLLYCLCLLNVGNISKEALFIFLKKMYEISKLKINSKLNKSSLYTFLKIFGDAKLLVDNSNKVLLLTDNIISNHINYKDSNFKKNYGVFKTQSNLDFVMALLLVYSKDIFCEQNFSLLQEKIEYLFKECLGFFVNSLDSIVNKALSLFDVNRWELKEHVICDNLLNEIKWLRQNLIWTNDDKRVNVPELKLNDNNLFINDLLNIVSDDDDEKMSDDDEKMSDKNENDKVEEIIKSKDKLSVVQSENNNDFDIEMKDNNNNNSNLELKLPDLDEDFNDKDVFNYENLFDDLEKFLATDTKIKIYFMGIRLKLTLNIDISHLKTKNPLIKYIKEYKLNKTQAFSLSNIIHELTSAKNFTKNWVYQIILLKYCFIIFNL